MKVASETSGRVSASVAQAIKEVRQAAGISQADLAAELGVSQPTISGWERGESAPGFDDISRVEKVCRHPKGAVMRLAGYASEHHRHIRIPAARPLQGVGQGFESPSAHWDRGVLAHPLTPPFTPNPLSSPG